MQDLVGQNRRKGVPAEQGVEAAAEKLPYDALLGHVSSLLSQVRTALHQ